MIKQNEKMMATSPGRIMEKGTSLKRRQAIINYYNKTRWDYRLFWSGRRSDHVMHFGYFGTGVNRHSDSLERLNHILADKVGIRPGDTILDAGCGPGASSLWLAANYKDVCIEGITLVPHQVAVARKAVAARKLGNQVQFGLRDYCNTGFPNEQFSVVWACESLCHSDQKAAFYKEAFRILKPGGRLIIADGIRKSRLFTPENEALFRKWLEGWCCPDLDTSEEHYRHVMMAGFSRFQMEDITACIQPSLLKLRSTAQKALPWGKLMRALGLRDQVSHDNLLSAIRQYDAFQNGLWTYEMLFAVKPE